MRGRIKPGFADELRNGRLFEAQTKEASVAVCDHEFAQTGVCYRAD